MRDSVGLWQAHRLSFQAAGLAYYLALSVAPVIIILTEIGGLVVGRTTAETDVLGPLGQLIGAHATGAIRGLVAAFFKRPSTALLSVVGIALLVLGAAGVFDQVKQTLDEIWGVKLRSVRGIFYVLRRSSLSVLLVGASVLLILMLVSATTYIAAAIHTAGASSPVVWSLYSINLLVSLAATSLLFGVTFKVLPDTKVRWSDVWAGAVCTAVLFIAGQFLIGFVLARSGLETQYGRATGMVVVLLWLYYSAQVFLFGATMTQAYAERYGSRSKREEAALERQVSAN